MAILGMTEVGVYLVDLDQRLLVPLDPAAGAPAQPLEIDNSLAGQAFRTQQIQHERALAGDGA